VLGSVVWKKNNDPFGTILSTSHYNTLCKFITLVSIQLLLQLLLTCSSQFATFPKGVFAITLKTSNSTWVNQSISFAFGIFISFAATHISSRHSRQLRVRVICRGDFHDISRDDVETIQTPQDGAQLAGRPASSLRRACGWCKSRVDRIDLRVLRKLLTPFT
jgi:hypothetical protein